MESLRRCSSPFTIFSMLLRSLEVDRCWKGEDEPRFRVADGASGTLLELSEDELQPSSELTGVLGLLPPEAPGPAAPQSAMSGGGVVEGVRLWKAASSGERGGGTGGDPASSRKPAVRNRNGDGEDAAAGTVYGEKRCCCLSLAATSE